MGETRGKGEGSVYRRKDGRWVGSIDCGRDRQGKRRRRRVVRRTRAECVRALADLRRQVGGGVVPDASRSLAEYLWWWLDTAKSARVKASTVASYRGACDRDIVPHLGHLKLSKITPGDVQQWMSTLEGFGLSAATVNRSRAVLGSALRHAAALGMAQSNPVSVVARLPQSSGGRLDDTLTATEAGAVLRTATGDRWYALAYVALHLGLRRGELVGLRWADIDLDSAVLHVRRTLQQRQWQHGCGDPMGCASGHHNTRCRKACRSHAYHCPQRTGGGMAEDTPKTQRSARTVPLVGGTVDVLRAHKATQAAERLAAGDTWADSGYVFCLADGSATPGREVWGWWQALCERAGIGKRRFHATRHTCATLLLDQDVELETISAILGHAKLATTADIYAKVTQDKKRRALAKVSLSVTLDIAAGQ